MAINEERGAYRATEPLTLDDLRASAREPKPEREQNRDDRGREPERGGPER